LGGKFLNWSAGQGNTTEQKEKTVQLTGPPPEKIISGKGGAIKRTAGTKHRNQNIKGCSTGP